jgi:hypothetical protein
MVLAKNQPTKQQQYQQQKEQIRRQIEQNRRSRHMLIQQQPFDF